MGAQNLFVEKKREMGAQIFTVGEKNEAEEQCSGGGPAVRAVRPGHWDPALGFRASCPDSRPSPTHLVFTRSCKVFILYLEGTLYHP